ncbi:class I SAM-dependent methyltransferase [Saccharopolyspora gloriosae]|uniref:class I SAM-dependent methyltransferase n=1 Tax=Saccharopolyspora gloriosae TaxID=455344 RepID=UPI001FB63BEC|nr:class I SAM-dependent methyltransferase [Saccharopolyspora gloriosae]
MSTEATALFDRGGRDYDTLVSANPGYHRDLARSARRLGLPGGGRGLRLLDVGCGTGASTRALHEALPEASITAVDGSARMLARARDKPWPATVRFVHADARRLPEAGVHGPFDGILAAYLLRNLPDPDAGLRLLLDLLRPGAPLAVHDYSLPRRNADRLLWHAICWTVIIPAGRYVTGDAALYRYLWRSVLEFDTPPQLTERMRRAGFARVRTAAMSGWQRTLTHTFLGNRPDA